MTQVVDEVRRDDDDDEAPLASNLPLDVDTHFDITAMIDLVFMMNIFFMVTSLTTAMAEVDLPLAKFATAADADTAVVVTIVAGPAPDSVSVLVNDGSAGKLNDKEEQEHAVRAAIDEGMKQGKKLVLIKAERKIHYRDVARLAQLASVAGAKLHIAVTEIR